MGIKQVTITTCTCDVCGEDCAKDESALKIQINSGDGRDVGPSYIYAKISVEHPYGCSNGIVCRKCQKEWFSHYFKED